MVMQAMEISRSGLDVEWRRLEVIAENIANLSTTRTAGGSGYAAQRLLSGPRATFGQLLASPQGGDLKGVIAYGLEATNTPPRRVYEPQHPHADASGFVSYPGFDQASEMTLLVKTARAYEANIVVLSSARQIYTKAMEIGKRS
jgi:flagellar basal-body rod protein FlgC